MFVNLSTNNEKICDIIQKKKLLQSFFFFIDSERFEKHQLTEINKVVMKLIIRLVLNVCIHFPTKYSKLCQNIFKLKEIVKDKDIIKCVNALIKINLK